MQRKILDIGCGKNKIPGAIGFDIVPLEGVDVVGDLRDPLPFEDNEFDIVNLNNVLEHFSDIVPIMKELHRITKPTGKILIMVPFYNSPLSIIDPTHKSYYHPKTFEYFKTGSYWNYYFDFSFKILKVKLFTTRLGSLIPRRFLLKFAQIFGNLITFIFVVLQPTK